MPTTFSNALYSSSNLGVVSDSTNFFTLSSTGNKLVLAVPGEIAGTKVVGVAYNQADWGAAADADARRTLTINTYSSGVSSGIQTTLTTSVSSQAGLSFALLLADRKAITLTYSGATVTYAADLSAAVTDVSDPNTRRLTLLGFI